MQRRTLDPDLGEQFDDGAGNVEAALEQLTRLRCVQCERQRSSTTVARGVVAGVSRAPRNTSSSRSVNASATDGNRWPYTSIVTVIEECPSRSWIAFGCAPSWMSNEAQVWRRSWSRSPEGRPACRTAGWKNRLY